MQNSCWRQQKPENFRFCVCFTEFQLWQLHFKYNLERFLVGNVKYNALEILLPTLIDITSVNQNLLA